MKPFKNTMVLKLILENTCIRINGVAMEIGLDVVAQNNHIVVMKVQVCKTPLKTFC